MLWVFGFCLVATIGATVFVVLDRFNRVTSELNDAHMALELSVSEMEVEKVKGHELAEQVASGHIVMKMLLARIETLERVIGTKSSSIDPLAIPLEANEA